MSRPPGRRGVPLALAVLLVTGLAGCGPGPGRSDAGTADAPPAATAGVAGVRTAGTGEVGTAGAGEVGPTEAGEVGTAGVVESVEAAEVESVEAALRSADAVVASGEAAVAEDG